MPTKCLIHNCTKPSVSRGLCDTHRKRVERHGTVESTRPNDWGAKEKHRHYGSWGSMRRYSKAEMPEAWVQDFWAFVRDTPPRPDGRAVAQRPDPSKPWGPENFYWREPQTPLSHRDDRAAYMREYSRKAREANPDYHKSAFLRRKYGITIQQYHEMLIAQGGVCAICGKAESNEIRGKVLSLAVDHDHKTGAVRELLCSSCNTALGLLNDDPALLSAAKAYLAKHLATPV